MKYPKKLKTGDTIGLVSPSSAIKAEKVETCRRTLEELGYKVKLSDNHAASKGGYMAGDEKIRGEWINKMFADSEVDAIFCVRGGDGANRIIDYIDSEIVRANPKIFVGYSDITSLHLFFNQQCNLITFHGPMVDSNIIDHFDEETQNAFFRCLNADEKYVYQPPKGFTIGVARGGKATGPLTGGNLTVMCASLGTPYEIDTEGKIIFIEEIKDHIGNMDRFIYQLRNAGKLKTAVGILLGQFTDCRFDEDNYDMVNVLLEATEEYGIPVMYNVQSGHQFPMINLPMGAVCTMDADAKTISFEMRK